MKALSLWQPHVQAVALGLKPWETRDWATSYRGPLALQAAKRRWDDRGAWHDEARRILGRHCQFPGTIPYGAVVCIVDMTDCVPTSQLRGRIPAEHEFWGDFSDGETGAGRFAFRLENVRLLTPPVPCRGQQGFFDVDLGANEVARRDTQTLSLFGEE